MAIKRRAKIGVVDFIHPLDDAIDEENSDLEKYRETWNPDYIALKDGVVPTKFKVNFSLNWKKDAGIKNSSLGLEDGKAKFMLGSMQVQTVKSVLVGIEQPEDIPPAERLPFVVDKKTGLLDDSTIQELSDLGVIDDIYSFYQVNKADSEHLKKK